MATSTENRTSILNDLQHKAQLGAGAYSPVTSTEEYFVQPQAPLAEAFKKTLESISGYCTIMQSESETFAEIAKMCENQTVFCNNPDLTALLNAHGISHNSDSEYTRTAKISITSCEALSARTASVAVSAAQIKGRRAIAAPETHIVIAYASQLCTDLPEVFARLQATYGENFPSQVTMITGPSRTADIEKTLVLGAHGPKKLQVFIIHNQ
ncbi:MAG: LUD domain-containing protein [Bacteroidales bacterium]|jgi:L-lactate dehydrogenase complex protein LldG|nr:LUD domain-containing protein [Bacteroidales bacterium]